MPDAYEAPTALELLALLKARQSEMAGGLSVVPEVVQDGYLHVKLINNNEERIPFRLMRGWRFEAQWLRIFFQDKNKSIPSWRIIEVEVVYNSDEVQTLLNARSDGCFDSCLKCGGEQNR